MGRTKRFFRASDIARIWGEERASAAGHDPAAAEPVSTETVYSYLKESRPARPGLPAARRPRYEDHPMPEPTYLRADPDTLEYTPAEPHPTHGRRGQVSVWFPAPGETVDELEERLRAWWRNRPGRGAGGGRPRRVLVECPCGCGQQIATGTLCDQQVRHQAGAA